jgi:hypothetical protein
MNCAGRVYTAGHFRSFPCQNQARWTATHISGGVAHYCGVHVRRYRKLRSYTVEAIA